VSLTARTSGDSLTLTVSDAGPGIAPEHLPHVFDRFYKTEAARPAEGEGSGGGSGLGLSIVKAIVERHGGRISVASRPGATTFTVAGLPVRERG
jgi:signal transduction histidine kinase